MKCLAVQCVIWGLLLACAGRALGELQAGVSEKAPQVESLIAALASVDPQQRDDAARRIVQMGAQARPAVLAGMHSDDPEIRGRCQGLILKLPWYRREDPPAIQGVLSAYGQLDPEKRKSVVTQFAVMDQAGYRVLARLIVEDPCDDVKWAVVSLVRRTYAEPRLELFRQLPCDLESAPLLAAMGHAWMVKDVAKGSGLLRRALAVELGAPGDDGGEVALAYDRLANLALWEGRYADLAQLLRQQARRERYDEHGGPGDAVLALFGGHGNFGPLAGFEKDLQTYRDDLDDPRMMFAVGKAYERSGQRMLARAMYRGAFLAGGVSIADRFECGDFLIRQGWLDLAQGEFAGILDLTHDHSGERQTSPQVDQANALFRLARVAAARDDDLAAAQTMQKALDVHHSLGGDLRGATEKGLTQGVSWHYLRCAQAKGDEAAITRLLEEFDDVLPENSDVVNDLVPMLRQRGRGTEADKLFARVYNALLDELKGQPDDPMSKNNIAWLCARCGEHKEQALRWAEEATQAAPDNAGFFDTLAEAHYQLGHYQEAARIEAKVVRARPGDRFLQKQLERFEKAARGAK